MLQKFGGAWAQPPCDGAYVPHETRLTLPSVSLPNLVVLAETVGM